jgi:hypothetical protein
MLPVETQELG